MGDFISRDYLLGEYDRQHQGPPGGARKIIAEAPAADVVEVRHAEWVAENSRPKSGLFYCSNCHRTCYDPQPTRAKGWTKRCRYHYCPNCGAVMDGGQDE